MQNKLQKIVYVITKASWGGAQRYVYDLATNLPDRDTHVVFGGQGLLEEMLKAAQVPHTKLSALSNRITPLTDLKVALELYRVFRREKPDVVHLNSSKIGIIGALAGKFALPTRGQAADKASCCSMTC
jgi:hypothetical protein